jgi:tetratricopeptide (TPR) repeat protein
LTKLIRNLERAVKLDPRNASTIADLAQIYFNLRRYEEAIALDYRALALEPRSIYLRMEAESLEASSRNTGRNGETNVTGGEAAAASMQRKAIAAIVNVSRIIAPVHITLSLPWGEQKGHNRTRVKY